MEEGTSVLHFVERSVGVSRVVFLDKISLAWLLANVEAMVKGESFKEFVRSSRVGGKAYIVVMVGTWHLWNMVVVGREASSSFQRGVLRPTIGS